MNCLNTNLRGELTPEINSSDSTRINFVATDGLMNMLSTRKGGVYDFVKEELENQLHKILLEANLRNAIPYVESFENEDIWARSHGKRELVHYYSKVGNTGVIQEFLEEENRNQRKESIFHSLDSLGRNATFVAFINGHLDIVKKLVKKGYFCVAPNHQILKLFIDVIKDDNLSRFIHLIFHGFSQLNQYLTYDGKNFAHLVNFCFASI